MPLAESDVRHGQGLELRVSVFTTLQILFNFSLSETWQEQRVDEGDQAHVLGFGAERRVCPAGRLAIARAEPVE